MTYPEYRFNEAIDIVRNEFFGLDRDQQYRNAFSRLLKWDPLDRVTMLGTDQRDLFVPLLKSMLEETVNENGHIFDFGGGDGQTFQLAATRLPPGVTVSIEEPNEKYIQKYAEWVSKNPLTKLGAVVISGFDQIDEYSRRKGIALPMTQSQCACLALHMIYFVEDLEAAIGKMYAYLRPGGKLFIVFADEANAYTGHACRAYYKHIGHQEKYGQSIQKCQNRFTLLGPEESGGGAIIDCLIKRYPKSKPVFHSCNQPSRLYGHTLADLIALCNITELSEIDDILKFEVAKNLLLHDPQSIGFRVETEEGVRKGMFSVLQPQIVTVIEKLSR